MTQQTEAAIAQEIKTLKAMQPTVRPYSKFGDDHRHAIGAQIEVLRKRMDLDDIDDEWPESDDAAHFTREAAIEAHDWYAGLVNDAAPSAGWADLVTI